MLSTKRKIEKLMMRGDRSLYDFAEAINVPYPDLMAVRFKGCASWQVTQAVNKHAMRLGLCPECLGETVPEGRCRVCLCGWSQCG